MGYYIGDIVIAAPNLGRLGTWLIIGKTPNTCNVQYRMVSLSAGAALCPFEFGNILDVFRYFISKRIQTMSREEMLTSTHPLIRRAGQGENVNGVTAETMMSEAVRTRMHKLVLHRKGW